MLTKRNIVIVHSVDRSMCGLLRLHCMTQLGAAGRTGEFQFVTSPEEIQDEYILSHTCAIVANKVMTEAGASMISSYGRKKRKFGYRLVLDYDDIIWKDVVPAYNGNRIDTEAVGKHIDSCLKYVDEVCLSTTRLAELWVDRFGCEKQYVSVVPNFVPRAWYGRARRRIADKITKPKILYGGSPAHFKDDDRGDFAGCWIPWLIDTVLDGRAEFHMFGRREQTHPMFFDISDRIVWHPWTSPWEWGSTLRDTGCDIFMAPLCENEFNCCKSNLKLLEASACGMALLGSSFPRGPYEEAHQLSKVCNSWSPDQLMQRVETICEQDNYNAIMEHQEQLIDKYWLEDDVHIGQLLSTWCRGCVEIS